MAALLPRRATKKLTPVYSYAVYTLVISLHYHAFFSWTMHTLHHIKDRSQLFSPRCSIIV